MDPGIFGTILECLLLNTTRKKLKLYLKSWWKCLNLSLNVYRDLYLRKYSLDTIDKVQEEAGYSKQPCLACPELEPSIGHLFEHKKLSLTQFLSLSITSSLFEWCIYAQNRAYVVVVSTVVYFPELLKNPKKIQLQIQCKKAPTIFFAWNRKYDEIPLCLRLYISYFSL